MMSTDTVLKDENGNRYPLLLVDPRAISGSRIVPMSIVVAYLNNKAVELFRAKKDPDAVMIRNLAEEIMMKVKPSLHQKAHDHKIEFPALLEDEPQEDTDDSA